MKRLLFLVFSVSFLNYTYGQDFGKSMPQPMVVKAEPKTKSVEEKLQDLNGTFTIVSKTEEKVLITLDLLNFVEANRKVSEDVTIPFNSSYDLIIPSQDLISSPNFQPLPLIESK